ncbi:MAG: type II toxin-antitoxin system RelE family toxin [Candidatus Nealsonbacteria bacterium]
MILILASKKQTVIFLFWILDTIIEKIEKLFRRINKKDRRKLLDIITDLVNGNTKSLNVQKIKNTDFYRLKSGRFRIIFHFYNKETIIDSIKLRNKTTYKRP